MLSIITDVHQENCKSVFMPQSSFLSIRCAGVGGTAVCNEVGEEIVEVEGTRIAIVGVSVPNRPRTHYGVVMSTDHGAW